MANGIKTFVTERIFGVLPSKGLCRRRVALGDRKGNGLRFSLWLEADASAARCVIAGFSFL